MLGAMLLLLTLGFGFTGYSLVWEQLSFWGATVAGNILHAVPFIGPDLADFLRGGPVVGSNMLTRLFVFHIGALPTLMVMVLFGPPVADAHAWRLGFGVAASPDAKRFPFIPDHLLTEIGLAMGLMFFLSFLAIVFPAGLGPKADPLVTPEHIKPEWYFSGPSAG